VNKATEVPGWLYDKLDTPWKNERRIRNQAGSPSLSVNSVGTHCGFIFETGGFIFEMAVSFLKYLSALFDWIVGSYSDRRTSYSRVCERYFWAS